MRSFYDSVVLNQFYTGKTGQIVSNGAEQEHGVTFRNNNHSITVSKNSKIWHSSWLKETHFSYRAFSNCKANAKM